MPDRYISDDQVIINIQGLRTVQRMDWSADRSEQPYRLMWSYKGQEHFQTYPDQAARDAMYEKLRKALTEKEQRQSGGYRKIVAIKLVRETGKACGLNIGLNASKAIIEALEPVMWPGGQGDAM